MGLHVPGIDDEKSLTSGDALRAVTSARQLEKDVVGSKSSFAVTYMGGPPAVKLRVQMQWVRYNGTGPLAATASVFSIIGRDKLKADTAYSQTMAAAKTGKDPIPGRFHKVIAFDSSRCWHYDFDRSPNAWSYVFMTVALHELGHGLFFTGGLVASRTASFQSLRGKPTRFDSFIEMNNSIGVTRSCDRRQTYQAITTRGLRFRAYDESTFLLHAPAKYEPGSSTYHLDGHALKAACHTYNISMSNCADFMTHSVGQGRYQHTVGEPTLRVMRTILGKGAGIAGSDSCTVSAAVKKPRFSRFKDTILNPAGLGGLAAVMLIALLRYIIFKWRRATQQSSSVSEAQ